MDINTTSQKTYANNIYDGSYLVPKKLFFSYFNQLPHSMYISSLNGEKALKYFREMYQHEIKEDMSEYYYYVRKRKQAFDNAVVVLHNNCLLEFDEDYCEILHDGTRPEFINQLIKELSRFKQPQRRQPLEINLVIHKRGTFELQSMAIKRTQLDISLYYEDDFKPVDELIRTRLNKNNDKGIVLLHGLPGTGKTTYLRYLIGKIKKRVLFLSPDAAANLMAPDFIQLLINNSNTVIVIEDAENVIMDRKLNSSSSVSNLLNISDGLLADCLNIQLICTFNSAMSMIDSALLRKGRLIAEYEFGKLGVEKSQKLSQHLGFDREIATPMTIAEITSIEVEVVNKRQRPVLGFRREAIVA